MPSTQPKDPKQSRKWQVTINNPADHGLTHDVIRDRLRAINSKTLYWCMCDEIGDEGKTLHTHLYLTRGTAFRFDQIKKLFDGAHIETAYGTNKENRDYVRKEGKKYNKQPDNHYKYTDKKGKLHAGINYIETFEESGDLPEEDDNVTVPVGEQVVNMVRDGATTEEIIEAVPSAYKDIEKINQLRALFRDKPFATKWRDLDVTYIYGYPGTGKTRSVVDQYGYDKLYIVSNYAQHPFDDYDGEDVIVFDEYREGFGISEMLRYLDGHPVKLPCRYANRQACYTKVYIISNIPLDEQYSYADSMTRLAFERRIHRVIKFDHFGIKTEYTSVEDWRAHNRKDKRYEKAI